MSRGLELQRVGSLVVNALSSRVQYLVLVMGGEKFYIWRTYSSAV